PARAKTQDESPATDFVQCVGHLCRQRRVTKRRAGHQWAKRDRACHRRNTAQKREDLPDATFRLLWKAKDEMICQPERREANIFCNSRDILHIREMRCCYIVRHEAKFHDMRSSLCYCCQGNSSK